MSFSFRLAALARLQATRWLAGLGLSPAQVTVGLLLTCSSSLAVLVLGMMTTLVRSLQR